MTSTSPAFSLGVPGLIQVFVAQILLPQGAIRTRAAPSPRAHSPMGPCASARAAVAAISARIESASLFVEIGILFSFLFD